ncbi:MAG: glycosyltransferase family 2 protein [Verrucomicrobiota bacterium]|jgi:GT2 family glycosyltransferase
MDLSIIIVNWHSAGYVRACLKSVFGTVSGLSFEVIVIDSGSGDGCEEMVAREFPVVRFVESKENLGFPKANNTAYRCAKGEVLLFLNPDAEVCEGTVLELWQSLRKLPQAGIVGARLLNSDGTLQTSCIQAFPTIWNQILDSEWLRQRSPRARLWGMAALFQEEAQPAEVDMVSGACLMVKREVFEQVGLFSTYCFMYVEDVDLCLKARRAGWKTYYVPEAQVVHHGGGSSTASTQTFGAVMAQESMKRFFECTRGRWYARAFTFALALAAAQRCLLLACIWLFQRMAGLKADTRFSLNKWLAIFRWAVGGETWVKKYGYS